MKIRLADSGIELETVPISQQVRVKVQTDRLDLNLYFNEQELDSFISDLHAVRACVYGHVNYVARFTSTFVMREK